MLPQFRRAADGAELGVAANHLGHFQLARHLAPGLEAAAAAGRDARVVVVSSSLHRHAAKRLGAIGFEEASKELCDLEGDPETYYLFENYAKTKLMNVLFAMAFAKRHPKLAVLSAHPGFVYTSVTRHLPRYVQLAHALAVPFVLFFQKLPGAGSNSPVPALLEPLFGARSIKGRSPYVADCQEEAARRVGLLGGRGFPGRASRGAPEHHAHAAPSRIEARAETALPP